jgi:exonuclease III
VRALAPDVLCLQEVTRSTTPLWRAALAGLHVHATAPAGGRRLAVLTATRAPAEPLGAVPGLPWPERVLRVRTADGVEVVNVHSPISQSPGRVKVLTHEALFAGLRDGAGPAVLCGDLNTPRREHADGTLTTFGRDERHDRAERLLLRELGWTDAFRAVNGLGERSPSWVWPHGGGWRLDHVLCRDLVPRGCVYLHEVRDHGLSDHSALLAELEPS